LHSILLAFPVALFPAALLADIAYLRSAEIQWTNFASWLIVGALLAATLLLAWAIVAAIRHRHRRAVLYTLLLAAAWGAGVANAFQHSRDAWSSVGAIGLFLSLVSSLAVIAAAWTAHAAARETAA
jgi:uncharacterized membrane protein